MGVKERTSRGAPCIFCGDIGYDMRVLYPDTEDVIHWCHKTSAQKGEIVSVNGDSYICIASKKHIEIGEFDLWKKYLTKEEWIAKQERLNPDWKSFKSSTANSGGLKPKSVNVFPSAEPVKGPVKGEEKPLPNDKLDKIYRAMLNMLVLEDKHRISLLKEWSSPIHDVTHLLVDYPIKSLPPVDKARFANKEVLKNPLRKNIVAELLRLFGDLRGVPGFYLRSGAYWDNKPAYERWTFTSIEGIIFPCYDKDGYLYRIRIKDDYPDRRVKENVHKPYKGEYGTFYHFYDKNGFHSYAFRVAGTNKVLPASADELYGKVNGKYKNFSSVHQVLSADKEVTNTMLGGSGSGSPYSLYSRPGDNYTVVLGTEGEKKGMIGNAIKHYPVATAAGVWNYSTMFAKDSSGESLIDYLKKKGMKYFIVCYDADKESKEEVLNAEASFVKELKSNGVIPMIGSWKQKFDKGLDDILLAGLDITISPVHW